MCHRSLIMKTILNHIKSWITSLFIVWRNEFYTITHDIGVMIFFIGLPLFYPLVYTLIYNPEVARDIPFVVIDNDRTQQSRDLVRMADATQSMKLVGYASNITEARRWLNKKACYGIMEIPENYEAKIKQNEQSVIAFYYDMSLLLRYRAFAETLTDIQIAMAHEQQQIHIDEINGITHLNIAYIDSQEFFLGDTTQGFASFVIPGILILILQQSLILGISMLGGTENELLKSNNIRPFKNITTSPSISLIGKALCYITIYIPLTIYILHFIPIIFNLPHSENFTNYMLLIIPFLFASIFMGFTLQPLAKERESSMVIIVFSSVIFLFLSGLTWPQYAMTFPWNLISKVIPSTWGIEGFIRINSNDATLSQNMISYYMLWLLSVLYFISAYWLRRAFHRQP